MAVSSGRMNSELRLLAHPVVALPEQRLAQARLPRAHLQMHPAAQPEARDRLRLHVYAGGHAGVQREDVGQAVAQARAAFIGAVAQALVHAAQHAIQQVLVVVKTIHEQFEPVRQAAQAHARAEVSNT